LIAWEDARPVGHAHLVVLIVRPFLSVEVLVLLPRSAPFASTGTRAGVDLREREVRSGYVDRPAHVLVEAAQR
jgi:hypothetical protein